MSMSYMYMVVSFFLFIFALLMGFVGLYLMKEDMMVFLDWELLSLNSLYFNMSILFDNFSMIFMSCVFLISSLVILYSYSYMSHDYYNYRFLLLLFMFIVSMMLLIISPNMVSILLGWDGLGLVSYCLVIFFQNKNSYNSGMLTILTNRIGDVAILMVIAWLLNFGSWNYIYYLSFYFSDLSLVIYLLILAGFTKSAQMPFSSWLPAAMAAPTPVSALVHSSTLVTAGVYLLIRFSNFLYNLDMTYFSIISCLTMFMSGLGANMEFDLKKIIALSTLSQLGLMMAILFFGYPQVAFFHMVCHAFFKALLFLCAGLVIHNMNNSQDIRDMGFVMKIMPYSFSCFYISSFSLCGLPYMSGFYSKDMVLELFSMNSFSLVYYMIFLFSVMLTASYSARLMMYMSYGRGGLYSFQGFYEDFFMIFPMLIMVIYSIFFGWGFSLLLFNTPVFIVLPFFIKILPLLFIFLGIFLGLFLLNIDCSSLFSFPLFFMGGMWFMPKISTMMSYTFVLNLSFLYTKSFDFGWSEYLFSKSHFFYIRWISVLSDFFWQNNIKVLMLSYMLIIFLILIY